MDLNVEEDVYDVIIVGAGPCGLATAARMREHTPAALFTDEEHRRFRFLRRHPKGSANPSHKDHKLGPKMLILDAEDDQWLGRWKRLFKTYDISHLRSPMFWHVDPLDRDALLAHAYHNEREDELVEIRNCVGKELSKHAHKKTRSKACNKACGAKQDARVSINLRERNDYFTPSQALFCDHCQDVVDRYRLGPELLRQESLLDLDYSVVRGVSIDDEKLFTVTTNSTRRYARVVILAVGPANRPSLPALPSIKNPLESTPQACHSMQIRDFPDPIVQQKMKAGRQTSVLVVGGGLTSGQLSDLAIRKGVTKVYHIMRGPLRVKHFDVGLEWMGKYKNAEQARFWTADTDLERLEIIKEARGGGSLTPLFNKRLKNHIAAKKLQVITNTKLVDARLEEKDGESQWTVETEPPMPNLPKFDYIYFATGIQSDFMTLPYLQKMLEKHPIPGHGGFPCLTENLMWKNDIPLFMVGRLAALQLGPAAPNIGGAKIGAERVAWAIEDLAAKNASWGAAGETEDAQYGSNQYLSGHGNMYHALAVE